MKIILLDPVRDSNYIDLIEFCASRGIELIEEKFSGSQQIKSKNIPDCDTSSN